MSVKSRLGRLSADVEWLEGDGRIRHLEIMFQIIEMKQEIADGLAADKEMAARFACLGLLRRLDLPPPSGAVRPGPSAPAPRPEPAREPSPEPAPPHPEERPVGSRLEGGAASEVRVPILRDASLRSAPQDEEVRVEPPLQPPEPEPVKPFTYDPPPEMQIRPVTWRRRGPRDYEDDEDDMYGKCIVDYDPLAEADADYDDE